jgi:hypothetical protein
MNSQEITLPQHLTPARVLAEAAFKKVTRPVAVAESEVEAQALRERTARLRQLRLARDQPPQAGSKASTTGTER